MVESAWGAVPGWLLVRFPRPLAEPAVPVSRQRALHGICPERQGSAQGLGILIRDSLASFRGPAMPPPAPAVP